MLMASTGTYLIPVPARVGCLVFSVVAATAATISTEMPPLPPVLAVVAAATISAEIPPLLLALAASRCSASILSSGWSEHRTNLN